MKLSNEYKYLADLFLGCIDYYGDESIKNNKIMVKWRNEHRYQYKYHIYDLIIIFFYEYDFMYKRNHNCYRDFQYYLESGVIKCAIKNTYDEKASQNKHLKNVIGDNNNFDTNFYYGFGIKF